jgi:hypothetical protein
MKKKNHTSHIIQGRPIHDNRCREKGNDDDDDDEGGNHEGKKN